ncbi:hypothetical protein DPEC_G00204160 [Dallia pectoralis]|uniref:Uncharacterized protein n=1 Tax=Dallia pectoralis TaxID=75939 RepID=A0ACC2G9L2_DALPE|nr:hypothetical protein DPEC_G00204160 [Dallia pectoralis]
MEVRYHREDMDYVKVLAQPTLLECQVWLVHHCQCQEEEFVTPQPAGPPPCRDQKASSQALPGPPQSRALMS